MEKQIGISSPTLKAHDTDVQREDPVRVEDLEQIISVQFMMNSNPNKKLYLQRSGSLPEYLGNIVVGRDTSTALKEELPHENTKDSKMIFDHVG